MQLGVRGLVGQQGPAGHPLLCPGCTISPGQLAGWATVDFHRALIIPMFPVLPRNKLDVLEKKEDGRGTAHWEEHLPSMFETWGSTPSTTKINT